MGSFDRSAARELLLHRDRTLRLGGRLAPQGAPAAARILRRGLEHVHARAESPIEKVLLSAIVLGVWGCDPRAPLVWDDDTEDPPDGRLHFRCQYEPGHDIHPATCRMRADSIWFVTARTRALDGRGLLGTRGPVIIIEADGHEWHKARFTADKQRDRAFHRDGFTVLRFSGTEIWADPLRCAGEAVTQFRASWGFGRTRS